MAPMALDSSLPNSNVYAYSSSNTQFLKHLICAPRHKYLVSDLEQERSWEREEKKKKKRKKYLVKKEKKKNWMWRWEKEKKFKVGSMNYKLSKISKWSIKEKIKEILNLI